MHDIVLLGTTPFPSRLQCAQVKCGFAMPSTSFVRCEPSSSSTMKHGTSVGGADASAPLQSLHPWVRVLTDCDPSVGDLLLLPPAGGPTGMKKSQSLCRVCLLRSLTSYGVVRGSWTLSSERQEWWDPSLIDPNRPPLLPPVSEQ